MREYEKMICRDLCGDYGHTVVFTTTDPDEIAAYIDACSIFSEGFAKTLKNGYSSIICRLEGSPTQYEFFA